MIGKKPIGLGFLLALAAMVAMVVSASGASAAVCTTNVLCSGAGATTKIRDDADATAGYGADVLASNTASTLRLLGKKEGTIAAENKNPAGYAYFGLKVSKNELTSTTACHVASGSVTFADIQKSEPSPVYGGYSPAGFGAWPFTINSDNTGCEAAKRGLVSISNVHLFLSALGGGLTATAVGTFTGNYLQPEEGGKATECTGGGIKLAIEQPGVTITISNGTVLTGAIDNGAGARAVLCFVSSNNVLFPTTAPAWTPRTGSIWKD